MKITYTFLLAILITSCCKEEVIASYPLSNYEKELIPYNGNNEIEYINEEGEIIIAITTPAIIETNNWKPGPGGCSYHKYQRSYSYLTFDSENFTLKLEVYKLFDGFFTITIKRDESDSINQGCRIPLDRPIEEKITDVSVGEYEFSNVVVFENCDFESDISRVIFSPERGMEFIEFNNDSYYKIK